MDALRAAMMVAGVFFHAALVYAPELPWRFKDPSEVDFFTWLCEFLHAFRMPAFFAMAGFFCALTFQREPGAATLYRRLAVFAVPFVAMMLSLQPLQYALKRDFHGSYFWLGTGFWGTYFGNGEFVSHLWFLGNLFFYYTATWIVLRVGGGRDPSGATARFLFRHKIAMTLIAGVCFLPSRELLEEAPSAGAFGLEDVLQYAPFFIVGYLLFRHARLFEQFKRATLLDLLALTALALLYYLSPLAGPAAAVVKVLWFYQSGFVLTAICIRLFQRFLDRQNRLTRLFADSAYTIYLFHHVLVVLLAAWLAERLPATAAVWKYLIVVSAVLLLTIAAHYLLIARIPLLGFLFNGRIRRPGRGSPLQSPRCNSRRKLSRASSPGHSSA